MTINKASCILNGRKLSQAPFSPVVKVRYNRRVLVNPGPNLIVCLFVYYLRL
jgi:hypothetical protein